MSAAKVFINKNYTNRDYECTNIVMCESETNPDELVWSEEHPHALEHFLSKHRGQHLYTQAGVRFYGYM